MLMQIIHGRLHSLKKAQNKDMRTQIANERMKDTYLNNRPKVFGDKVLGFAFG